MRQRDGTIRTVQVLLTITALEFFGPIGRDYSPSHAFNPTWVGHARLHLVWLLGFMGLSGLANLWLVWLRRPFEVRNLWLSVIWQCCNLGGFWIAYALVDSYGGVVALPETHVHIFGWDENVFAFAVLSTVMAIACMLLVRAGNGERRRATS
jgi:hypothetical protein